MELLFYRSRSGLLHTYKIVVVEGGIGAGKTEFVRALADGLPAVAPRFRVRPVYEPVDQWVASGMLAAFYADPKRWAYTFQTYVYATRVMAIVEAVSSWKASLDAADTAAAAEDVDEMPPDYAADAADTATDEPTITVFLLERSPATDRMFMELQDVTPLERCLYNEWADTYDRLLATVGINLRRAICIYLAVDPETCQQRLAGRGREGETDAGDTGATAAAKQAEDLYQAKPTGVSLEYQQRLAEQHMYFLLGRPPRTPDEAPIEPTAPYARTITVPDEICQLNIHHEPERVTAWAVDALLL